MTVAEMVAVAFLAVLVLLILRGIRGHRRSGDGSADDFGRGPGDTGD